MKTWLRQNKGFVAFLLCFGLFRTAVADWNPIPSGSMRPTLLEGDVVFVDRLAYDLKLPLSDIVLLPLADPRRGDIVTFSSPKDGSRLIKRIVGMPGDRIEMQGDRLLVNGRPARYDALELGQEELGRGFALRSLRATETVGEVAHAVQFLPTLAARRDFGPVVVPPDSFFMLGDNRDNSEDSRYIGVVPRARLIGRATRLLVSADVLGDWRPRLGRFGQRLQ